MSILVNQNTRLLVQGITGQEGLFHTEKMLSYGTRVVAEKIKRLASSMKVDAIDIYLSVAVGGVVACEGEKGEELVQRGLLEIDKALKLSAAISVES